MRLSRQMEFCSTWCNVSLPGICLQGLAYYSDWGTLRNTGNMMFIAAVMGKYGSNAQSHICWARSQMRYITGAETQVNCTSCTSVNRHELHTCR